LVEVGVVFPDGEPEMLQPEPSPVELITQTPPKLDGGEVSIHSIGGTAGWRKGCCRI
jgi:hypothetical protein